MKDVMLDIEAFGKCENKLIVQIGACYFDRATGEIGRTFKMNIDPIDAERKGFKIDADTVLWWMQQSDAARASVVADPKLPIIEVFNALNEFLKDAGQIWSHSTYDFVSITQTYSVLGIKPLFGFRTARDIRTLMDMFKVTVDKVSREGVHHDALADCFHQVKYCMEAFKKMDGLTQAKQVVSFIKGLK